MSDIESAFLTKVVELGKLSEGDLEIMKSEGEMYITSPQDLQEVVKGFVELWTTGSPKRLNSSQVQHMYSKLVEVYKMSEILAYSLCEHYVRIRVYGLVASV